MPLIPLEDAQAHVLRACPPLGTVTLALAEALGHVTARDVTAPDDVPPFDNTAMDGFAVRAADTAGAPVELEVVGTLAAGAGPGRGPGPGEAIRIMTGAPLPPGADAVVMVELTRPGAGQRVLVSQAVAPGEHVRRAGTDMAAGSLVFPSGTELRPGHLGVLASVGCERMEVARRPRVGVLSTGDELVSGGASAAGPDPRLEPGGPQRRRSVRRLWKSSTWESLETSPAPSRPPSARGWPAAMPSSAQGASAWGTSISPRLSWTSCPGAPCGGCRWPSVRPSPSPSGWWTGCPSSGYRKPRLVTGQLLNASPVLPFGRWRVTPGPAAAAFPALAADGLPRQPDGKLHLVRVGLELDDSGRWLARSAGGQSSHQLLAMAMADGLALLPDGPGVKPGGHLQVLLLDD